ncbi:CDP-diacylglycerol--glycerol-3-phosphate 3-phosphatidyltransferase [Caloranaerobacter azorensis]|uniref:CDP-diacylglycerol--glycerol-3-phosphate 3-phosphatidyltransferase n=3 Tax=Caloranaerobacter azorensis TaxID=116090 RepID=A0A1M5WNE9_9FIRM|nr:CDP-diacylglycerol--glycerol-3-phosphate 3-phosphatidyltransferase [Caloranaerobacter azorensis]KGG80278.1 CDP-diacylglycerol--glycerol-3-phosphate 3-phosphatidyltransferase [Caloranaerobacter azorensis H53214]QIB26134.1 CDP-diacylglycerol--glycerol-3-phosphate 3-phosphatidyltransferase [Caloranaerobacter azorensis]SHH89039.1 CDP-diacylglycerol--glycerol-3-phosphate 3-phosphatidyltransferase [Caloranaerobacter azorensis DSM 13643]
MNLANKLTIIRIFLVPVFMFFLLVKIPYGEYIAAFIFILAALTDSLDGYIARKRNQVTKFGKFMDPLADKLLVSAALISLIEKGKLSAWIVILIIAREFAITGLRVLAASEGITIAASWWGKIKTISQIVAIITLLLDNYPFRLINIPFDKISVALAVIFTLISGFDYLYKNKNVYLSGNK